MPSSSESGSLWSVPRAGLLVVGEAVAVEVDRRRGRRGRRSVPAVVGAAVVDHRRRDVEVLARASSAGTIAAIDDGGRLIAGVRQVRRAGERAGAAGLDHRAAASTTVPATTMTNAGVRRLRPDSAHLPASSRWRSSTSWSRRRGRSAVARCGRDEGDDVESGGGIRRPATRLGHGDRRPRHAGVGAELCLTVPQQGTPPSDPVTMAAPSPRASEDRRPPVRSSCSRSR